MINPSVPTEMQAKIKAFIEEIEHEKNIRVILCVEAGSRSWGLPSKDSDYDIRFVFAYPPRKYVSLIPKEENIVYNNGDFDAKGVDLKGAFRLIQMNEPSIYEWLESPIIYKIDYDYVWLVQKAAKDCFDMGALAHRYYAIAKKIYLKDISWVDNVRVKKYLYAFRSILCCHYVLDNNSPVPLNMNALIRYLPDDYTEELNRILNYKTETVENARMDKSYALEDLLLEELSILEKKMYGNFANEDPSAWDKLDDLLFDYISYDWNARS